MRDGTRFGMSLRHHDGEPRSQIRVQRERDTPRCDRGDFIEAGQFFGGALEKAEGGGLQGWLDVKSYPNRQL